MGMDRRGHSHVIRRRLTWVLGAVALLPLIHIDPAALPLLFDTELVVLLGSIGVAMTRDSLRYAWERLRSSTVAIDVQVGVALSREQPRSLLWVGQPS